MLSAIAEAGANEGAAEALDERGMGLRELGHDEPP
jgi:hypothetical protein